MHTFTQAQLVVSIIIALFVGFNLGRLYQIALGKWTTWKDRKAEVPTLRKNAFESVGVAVKGGGFALLVIVVLVAAAFAGGMAG